MTDLQYQLMLRIKRDQPCPDEMFSQEEQLILQICVNEKWVRFTRTALNAVLTQRGEAAILEHKNELEQREREKSEQAAQRAADRAYADENTQKQFKHDWRIAIFETFTGFILGAIADHFLDIVGNAARLWLALKHVFLN